MKTIGNIFGGIALGMILAVLIGTVMFQGVLFDRGMETLGIGPIGLTYFLGGFIASLILMFFPGARNYKRFMGFFPITVVMVGAIALSGLMTEFAPSYQGSGPNLQRMVSEMGRMVALLFFWGTPAAMTAFFAGMYWTAKQVPSVKPEQA